MEVERVAVCGGREASCVCSTDNAGGTECESVVLCMIVGRG